MVDIAEIGFRADTSDLDRVNKKLHELRPSAERVEGAADDLNRTMTRTNGVLGRVANGATTTTSVFGRLSNGVRSLTSGLMGIATGVIAGFAFESMISGARELSASLSELATLLPAGSAELDAMREAARAMADEFGTSAAFQIKAFYGAVSAGATDAAAAIDIVDTANKLAIGGITDVGTGVDILTTATNAYASTGLLAADASDALFTGMRAGKTTVGELASGLGNVIPIAASLGVEFDELVAGTAALTLQGLSTATAITSLRAILSAVAGANGASAAGKVAKQLGIDFSTAGLRAKGLAGFLADVVEKTDGSADSLSVLFGSVEALNAALAFAGSGGESFNQILEQMETKAGATDAALTTVQQGLDQRWGLLLQKLTNLSIDFGYALLSVIVPAGEAVAKVFELAADNADVFAIALGVLVARQIPAMIAGLVRMGAMLTTIQAQFIAGAIAARGLTLAMSSIPFVAIVTGLTLAWRWFTRSGEAADVAATSIDGLDDSSAKLTGTLQNVISGLAQTEAQLKSISLTEGLLAQKRYTDEYRNSLQNVGSELAMAAYAAEQLNGRVGREGVEALRAFIFETGYANTELQELSSIDLGQLSNSLDELVAGEPQFLSIVESLRASITNAQKFGTELETTNALMRFLNGEASDADRILLNIAGTNISDNIAAGANEVNRLANELRRAYDNMISLSAQGISSLRESEIRLENRGDPVATAGALAEEEFGDITAFHPIMQPVLAEQRDEFIANAEATEMNRQALIEYQRQQAAVAAAVGSSGDAISEQQTALQQLAVQYGALNEPFSQAQSAFDAVQTAMQNGVLNNDQFVQSLERIKAAFLATGGTAEQWQNIVNKSTDDVSSQMKDLAEGALTSLGDEFINLAVEGKASFGDLAKSIIKDLLRIAFQALVVKPLLNSFAFSGGGSFGGGGALPNATGNAFGNSGVTPFANGGSFTNSIVNTATPFTFAKGAALGVMGEAGPEAIMPLERGANGSLGVQMFGGAAKSANMNNSVKVENTYKIEGAVSEEKVLANIKAQGENTKEDVRKSMVGWLTDYEQNGTM
jgi:TP901 family phage tail tape measure protein/lambda family phage tail tape measure protein